MPNWKKVIVSGSNVSQLFNDGVYLRTTGDGVISSSAQLATQISGAFTATSAAFDGRISSLSSSSTTFAGTGSNTFKGDQTFSGSLLPETTEVFTLGSPDKVWESLYVDGQSIYMRDVATNTFVTMSANAGVLTFNNTRLNVPLGITSSNLILTSIVNAGTDTDKFLVLDTNGNVDFRTGTEILSDIGGQGLSAGTVSSSAQIQAYDIFLEKLGDNVISSSAQLTTEFDTRYLNTSGDGVISSSAQVDHDSTTNFVANEHIDHTTVSISAGSGLSGGGTIASTRTLTLDTSSVHFTDGVKTKLNTDGVISSSAQLTIEFDTRYLNTSGDGVISSSAQIATDISGAFTATSGGLSTRITSLEAAGGTTFSSSVSTRLTNVEGYTLDNVTDNGSSTTNGITVGGLTVNGNATITGTLTAQQFNTEFVSSSIIFESGSTKFGDSIDDIHSFTGSVKLNTQTAATTDTDKFLVFDTGGEIKYRTGAEVLGDINPGGLVSSSAQLTTEFDTRYLNTTGDGVISSSAQIASDISGAFAGAGFVDTTGTPANNQIAIFTDSNTIEGSSNVTFDNSTFQISGSSLVVNGPYSPTPAVDFQMAGVSYFRIDGIDGAIFDGGLSVTGQIGVYPTAGSGLQINTATYGGPNVDSFITLAASSSGATGTGSFWSYGIKASDNSHDFVFVNASALSGVGVPSPSFTISKANNQVKIGSLVVSGSGTLINIGPAQFSGSVNITTADQVAASVDTDKFLVLDGQQIKYRTGAEVLSDINPGGLVSSSAQLTSTFDTRYLNTTGDNVLSSSAQISSVASASFASNGHNFVATGTSEIDALQLGSLTTGIASFISATGSFVPNNSTNFTIFTINVLTNEALFIDYVIQDFARNNKRAGNLRFTWNATDTVFDETSTTSIGNTNNFTFSTNNNGTNLNVLVNNTTGQGMSIIFEYKILYIQ